MRTTSFAISVHGVKAADVTISAKSEGTTHWISLEFAGGDHGVTVFANSPEDFKLLCSLFNINRNEELSVDPLEANR